MEKCLKSVKRCADCGQGQHSIRPRIGTSLANPHRVFIILDYHVKKLFNLKIENEWSGDESIILF